MMSRALSLATVTLLIGCLSAGSGHAQNLEAGKSPSQIFAGTCSACHKTPRGLLKSVPAGSLPGFLRQHYTTSSDMAGVLASYLVSNGAADPRYQGKDHPRGAKGGRDARQEANQPPEQQTERPARRQHQGAAPQEAVRPDADGLPPGEARPGHRSKRAARPSETPDGATPADGQPQGASEGKPSRKKLGRRGKPADEPKSDEGARSETPKDEPRSQSAKTDSAPKSESKSEDKGDTEKPAKPADQSDSAKVDAPKGNAGSERSDPVTPAPAAAVPEPSPSPAAAASPTPAPPVTATAPLPPAPTGAPAGPPVAPVSK
ncbi:hypothetical protein JQ633_11090 [Bradyrhizobium tropiciagri]|uniref:hypothetical protein n=1 Tax=Bradyrhizobium tropiciagri TaxID=312253 RepID=UPI001BA97783|nr:hypothetical protein [Bradyrhizobium tropiciagri]MBR0870904.1 hypothetical protein [Bradyrhizobium tropiciagri]